MGTYRRWLPPILGWLTVEPVAVAEVWWHNREASLYSQEPAHPVAGTQPRCCVLYDWVRGLFLGSCPEPDSLGLKEKPLLRLKEEL